MKKERVLLLPAIAFTAVLLTACDSNASKENTQYVKMSDLNGNIAIEMPGTGSESSDDMKGKVSGDSGKTTTQRTVLVDSKIFSEPDKKASVIGSLKKDDLIDVIEEVKDGLWFKVVYSGRIAYIYSSAFDTENAANANVSTNATVTNTNNQVADNTDNTITDENPGGGNDNGGGGGGNNPGNNDDGGNDDGGNDDGGDDNPSQPDNPEPTNPVNPDPEPSDPDNPDPANPDPDNPEPGSPEPGNPDPGDNPDNPEPTNPEPTSPDPGSDDNNPESVELNLAYYFGLY
ncbi:MAG: SH3 domain-containing protein [Lachnospiraceae bacterium]|nr:SH3 domain-containing protein [Lachnospiraceae bacterium]